MNMIFPHDQLDQKSFLSAVMVKHVTKSCYLKAAMKKELVYLIERTNNILGIQWPLEIAIPTEVTVQG